MGAPTTLLVLFGFVGSAFSILQMPPKDPIWVQIGETASLEGSWEHDLQSESFQELEWKAKSKGIRRNTKDNDGATFFYDNSPINASRLTEYTDWVGAPSEDDPSLTKYSSILTIEEFQVTDPENYTCEIDIGQQQLSTIIRVRAYLEPMVSMANVVTKVDLRPEVLKSTEPAMTGEKIPEYGEGNSTEEEDMTGQGDGTTEDGEDYNAEGSDNDYGDYYGDSQSDSRKKRQASESATMEEGGTDEEQQYVEVECVIEDAYPKPQKVEFHIGESVVKEPTTNPTWTQDPETKLYTGTAVLRLEADPMYDQKEVTCSVVLTATPQRKVDSSNNSAPFQILYETSEVETVISPGDVVEGQKVLLECRANGNPQPMFEIKPDSNFVEISTGQYEIDSAHRDDDGEYTCVATMTDERDNSTKTLDSETSEKLTVNYIDTPDLSEKESTIKVTKGDDLTIECSASGRPSPNTHWKKDGEDFSSSSILSLKSVDYNSGGKYECSTVNAAGSKSKSITVEVEGTCEIDFKKPFVSSSSKTEGTFTIRLECITEGAPDCDVSIKPQSGFTVSPVKREGGKKKSVVTYDAVEELTSPVKFYCVASNKYTPAYNKSVSVGSSSMACCAEPKTGGIGTGAIVGILLLVLVVVIGIPVACYFVKKRNATPTKKAPADAEAGPTEKENLNKEASSEDSDTGSLPPPPADTDHDRRLNNPHEMTTFSTNK